MYLSQQDIDDLDRIKRINIINSVTGIKPANLVGTRSSEGQPNLAIISSVVHLGSNPALIGCIFRPQEPNKSDSYANIRSSGYYTINHIPSQLIERAHFTSAKFPKTISEFERCGIQEEALYGFQAPFVKESPLKMGLKMVEEIPIKLNNTILIVGQIEHLEFDGKAFEESGNLNLDKLGSVGVGGVNTYYGLQQLERFPYAHLSDVPQFVDHEKK